MPPFSQRYGTAFSIAVALAILLFSPDSWFARMNATWGLGCLLLPVMFVVGLASAALHQRRGSPAGPDPFAVRARWSLFSGLAALPVALLFRPAVAHLAFVTFCFGLGPVLAHWFYTRRRRAPRA